MNNELFKEARAGAFQKFRLPADLTDAVIFGILSIFSTSVIYRVKIRGYVLEQKLHIMSDTDQLTGLNNRNCYEMRLSLNTGQYKTSICCIYLDVNGLQAYNKVSVYRHFGKSGMPWEQ